jgi:hypothetical protein
MANPNQQYYHGALNISWGLGSTTYAVSGVTGIFQSSDNESMADRTLIKDQRNSTVSTVDSDPHQTVTLEYYTSDATTPNAGNAAIVWPYSGVMVTVTTDATDPTGATNWIVDTATTKRIFNDATKVTLKCSRYYLVTL